MASWNNGYVTDSVYVSAFNRYATPAWLAVVATLGGQPVPGLAAPFRYADLGCGNGLTALVVAATHPNAQVWGFDFNPAHIEFASELAASAGLTNVAFVETSFDAIATAGDQRLPPMDFVVTHGVLSWISSETEAALVHCIGRLLRPGGLLYVSYNVATSRANMVPVRTLMRQLLRPVRGGTDAAVAEVLSRVERLREAGAAYFQLNPALETLWAGLQSQDVRYLAHEYLNQDWRPLMFADVAAHLEEAKCSFVASATLETNVLATAVPPGVIPLLAEIDDPATEETMRDLAAARSFRRDVFRRGRRPVRAQANSAAVDALRFGSLHREAAGPPSFKTNFGTISTDAALHHALTARLSASTATVAELRDALPGHTQAQIFQALLLLMEDSQVHPMLADEIGGAGREPAQRLNRAMAAFNASGGSLDRLAVPAMGTAIPCDAVDIAMVAAMLEGGPADAEALGREVLARLPVSASAASGEAEALRQGVVLEVERRLRRFRPAALGVVAG